MPANRVLIIDDEPDIRFAIRDYLDVLGYAVSEAGDCESGLEAFKTWSPDVAIVDYRLPDGTVFDLLPSMQDIDENVPILVLTGHGSIDLAVRAMKEGAEQFFYDGTVRNLADKLSRLAARIENAALWPNSISPAILTDHLRWINLARRYDKALESLR